jgi:hypothetical protein
MRKHLPGRLLGLIVGTIVIALGAGAQAQAPKALIGTWKLNLAKSRFNPGPAPKAMTIVYSAAGEGVKIVADVTPAEGAAQRWEMSGNYDGKDNPITGNPAADKVSFKKVDDRTGESIFKKDGKVTATNHRVLSADGKTLTITSKGLTADGKPRSDVQVFDKQ